MSETLGPDVVTPTPPPLPVPAAPAGAPARLQCANCGGAVLFTPGTSAVTCIQCASQFPIADGVAGEEHSLQAGVADPRAGEGGDPNATVGAGELSQDLVCPNCHGAVTFVGTLTATRCPFCARPVTSDDVRAAPNRFPVDGIVPFGLDQAAAEKNVRAWMSKRKWAPRAFKKFAATGSFTGIYLPFFTFDVDTVSEYRGRRGYDKTRQVRDKDGHTRTETYIDWDPVEGRVAKKLDDVPISADSSVDRDRMRELEPWPSEDAVGFRPEYVAGFLARRYDRSLEQCLDDVRPRMEELVDEAIKGDIGGQYQEIKSKDTTWSNETFRHLLLPVFLLVVTYRSKPYQVAVNGMTGEVHGKRPFSWVKIGAVALAAITALVAFGIYVVQSGGGDSSSGTSQSQSQSLQAQREATDQQIAAMKAATAAQAAAEAARVYTPDECENAVSVYRFKTPDTYFPSVVPCAKLTAEQRLAIGKGLFEQDQIAAANRATKPFVDGPKPKGNADYCRAAWAVAVAKLAAHKDTAASDQSFVTFACSGLKQPTIDQIGNDETDQYIERRKQALADAH